MEATIISVFTISFLALVVRKFYLVLFGETTRDKLVKSVISELKTELGISNCHYSLDYSLAVHNRPIHLVDNKHSLLMTGFKAKDAHLQPIGETMFFVCYFEKSNAFDEIPDKLIATSGKFELISFIKLLSPREIMDLQKLKTNFNHFYLVGVTRSSAKTLSAIIYLSKQTLDSPILEIRRRQDERSFISKVFN